MSILALTSDQQVSAQVADIQGMINTNFCQNKVFFNKVFNLFFNNTNPNCTPIALAASMGTSCGTLMTLSGAFGTVIHTLDPTYVKPVPDPTKWTVVVNGDNSVTITAVT